jgi:hypothetical protein
MHSVVFGEGLIAAVGDQHKKQRKMLNPVFSTMHLRGMTPTFFTIAKQVSSSLDHIIAFHYLFYHSSRKLYYLKSSLDPQKSTCWDG